MLINKLTYKKIDSYDNNLIRQVVDIHYDALSYESFITSFGKKFLGKLYKVILSNKVGSIILALDSKDNVAGFILYSKDTSQLYKVIFRKLHLLLNDMITSLFFKPQMIFKLVQTPFYFKKEGSKVKAELLVISVVPNYRSSHVGEQLVDILNKEYKKIGVNEYKVTVLEKMVDSNRFYKKLNMKLESSFNMYGKKWNLYVKKLTHE